jgi:hypothetical protein
MPHHVASLFLIASGMWGSDPQAEPHRIQYGRGERTLEAICRKFGWQAHTTRALMSAGGSLRKKHGITVISEKVGDLRTYNTERSYGPSRENGTI